jgi:hypothetical protein
VSGYEDNREEQHAANWTCVDVTSGFGGVPSTASGYNLIQNFKGERMKGVNDTHVIKERKGTKEFTDLF